MYIKIYANSELLSDAFAGRFLKNPDLNADEFVISVLC